MKHNRHHHVLVVLTAVAMAIAAAVWFRAASSFGQGQATDPAVVSTLRNLLQSPRPDVKTAALAWMARDPRAQSSEFVPVVFEDLKHSDANVRDKALANLGWILDRSHGTPTGAAAIAAIEAALKQSSDRAAELQALSLIGGSGTGGVYSDLKAGGENPYLIDNPAIRKMLVAMLADPESSVRPQVIALVSGSATLRADPALVSATADALNDDELNVRNAAIRLLTGVYHNGEPGSRTAAKPALEAALRSQDPNVRLQASQALGVPLPPAPPPVKLVSLTGARLSMADVPFGFNYFTAFVQPLFVKKYGGASCIQCHAVGGNASGEFRLLAPSPDGKFTLQQSRVNFVSVMAVINRKHPMQSKLLLKPLDPQTREGSIRGMNHDGGVFWKNQYDPDFKIVADWLNGAKLEDPPQKQLDFAYFRSNVERIFSTPGPDGFACITCHFSHAILHLESPESAKGAFSVEEVINNYQSALRVVDEGSPADSYIVRKPTSPREGVAGGLSHAGGVRWPSQKQSWQYKTLMRWIAMHNLASGSSRTLNASAGKAGSTAP